MFTMLEIEKREMQRAAKRAAKKFTMAKLQEKCRQAEVDGLEELVYIYRQAIYHKD